MRGVFFLLLSLTLTFFINAKLLTMPTLKILKMAFEMSRAVDTTLVPSSLHTLAPSEIYLLS